MAFKKYNCNSVIRSGSVVATFDLAYQGFMNEGAMRKVLEDQVRSGKLGDFVVSMDSFDFQSMTSEFNLKF